MDSFYKTLFIVNPVMFLMTFNVNLRGAYDLKSYCSESVIDTHGRGTFVNTADPMMQLFQSVQQTDYLRQGIGCRTYSEEQIFQYNYYIWTFAFFLGLQWTHMGQGILGRFVLSWDIMKTWPAILWAVFVALIVGALALVAVMFVHYRAAHVLPQYAIWLIALPSWFYYKSRGCKNVHLHHYSLMMIILSFLSYQDAFTTLLSGYFNGVMIEGAANYGYDVIFEKGEKVDENLEEIKVELRNSQVKIDNQRLTHLL